MKSHIILFGVVVFVFCLLPFGFVQAQVQTDYEIEVKLDCTAFWIVRQTGPNIQFSPDASRDLEDKLSSLVSEARNLTGRTMSASVEAIRYSVSGSYSSVEYYFKWVNFSRTDNERILIGDVFQAADFFGRLYDDGSVSIHYPEDYSTETVNPSPFMANSSVRIVTWLGTGDFDTGEPQIMLKKGSAAITLYEVLVQNLAPISALLVVGVIAPTLYYLFIFRARKKNAQQALSLGSDSLAMKSDEDKVTEILKSSGGTLFQTAISDRCGFSKAKTSQLLSLMENKKLIKRIKRGRDKIVTLA